MGPTDALPPVSHGDHHLQLRPRHFQTGRVCERTAVQAMECMGVEKRVEQAGTADVTDDNDLMPGQIHILKCMIQGVSDAFMGAPRTKYRRSFRI
jgi:hypothetical protein